MPRPSSDPPQEPQLPRGSMVGEYQLDTVYESGSMGTIYQANHPVIGKRVAVKVLRASMSGVPRLVERFVNEARAVNRIGHPNIVDVFSFGKLPDGRSYFVMEWLEGQTLDKRLTERQLPPLEVLRILEQLADALSAAHAAGVVHCDLKPANVIILERDGRPFVKLLDFGIAQLGAASTVKDQPRRLSGTPAYMAPEQVMMQGISPAADVYALGVIAYELFLHRLPHQGKTIRELLQTKISQAPERPSNLRANIPTALEDMILDTLAREPEDRPGLATVREELAELQRAFLLAESLQTIGLGGKRPVLFRRFDRVGDLVRPLLTELSSSVAWAEARGPTPAPGTPITVRFTAERYGVAIDLAGLVEHQLGVESHRTLIRYDPISEDKLSQIMAVAALPGTTKEGAPETAEWLSASQSPDASIPPVGDLTEAGPTGAMDVRVSRTLDTQSLLLHLPLDKEGRLEQETAQTTDLRPAAPTRFQLGGLGAKVTALTLAVTVLAVLSVVILALNRVQHDRAYYFEELALRTALYVQDATTERLRSRAREVQALTDGQIDTVSGHGLIGLLTCRKKDCLEAAGKVPPSQRNAWKETPKGAAIRQTEHGVLISHRRGQKGSLLWIAPKSLLPNESVPDTFSVQVHHSTAGLILTRGPINTSLPADILNAPQAGGRRINDPDGKELIVAWSGAKDTKAAVMIDARVATAAILRLAKEALGLAVVVLLIAAGVALVFARGLTQRLRRLTRRASDIAQGRFAEAAMLEGEDEVGQLVRSFSDMSRALRDRDREVLRIRREMTEQETRAAQRRLADELQTRLVTTLEHMETILQEKVTDDDSLRSYRRRENELESLVKNAMTATKRAVMTAQIGRSRVDFASVVADAVDYGRRNLKRADVRLSFEAPNAVFFPQLDARESELREMIYAIIEAWAEQARPEDRADVTIRHHDDWLLLSVSAPETPDLESVWGDTLRQLARVIAGHRAYTKVKPQDGFVSVVLGFQVPSEDNAPE